MLRHLFLLLGLRIPRFVRQTNYQANAGTYFLEVADFNNDRSLDIVASNNVSGTISIFYNKGNGRFYSQKIYSTGGKGSDVDTLTVADLNCDGYVDIIAPNYGLDYIGIFKNKRGGTFAPQVTLFTGAGSGPISVDTAYLNKDRYPDIVVANNKVDNIGVLLSKGPGIFDSMVTYSTGPGSAPRSLVLADLNCDHKDDVIVANRGGSNIGVLFNQGGGKFGSLTTYSTGAGSSPRAVAVVDLNGDDKLDVVCINTGTNNIYIFFNSGDGTLSLTKILSTGLAPRGVAIANINNDRKPDIVYANSGDDNFALYANEGFSKFVPQGPYPIGSHSEPYGIAVGDFNHDGRVDIATANFGTASVTIFFNAGY
ncbi:unnamed protein product [Rotaria sordida]|uniref:VCBS repeat-containing protein n=1 Tax=Rotaria sordida TaxID=392033 RepID=A0A814CDQ5_9BILA|nr:unnamed protein product [Rotaria sordida]